MQIHKDLREFRDQHKTPATVVLISGDIDFVGDINELRFSGKHYTIVIHNVQAKEELLKTANEFIPWEEFVYKNESKSSHAVRTPGELTNETVKQPQMPRIAKTKDNSGRTSSPRHNFAKPTANTDDNVLESPSTVVNRPKREKPRHCAKKTDVSNNKACAKKQHHKNEKEYVSNKWC